MNVKRYMLWGGVALVVVVVLFLGLRPQSVLVEVAEVERSELRVTIDEEGITRVKDRYLVSAPVAGFVRRTKLEVGDRVARQDMLTELEPLRSNVLDPRSRAEAEARVAAANSALHSAQEQASAVKADASYAESEYQRKLPLRKKQLISVEELSQAKTATDRAKAMVRSADFAIDVARYELDAASTLLKYSAADDAGGVLKERVAIRAPVIGTVLKIHRESEGVVNAGAPLVELGDPRALEVAVDVLSFDAVRIKPGTPVELKRWGGDSLQGIVKLIEPVGFTQVSALGVEEQRVWVILDITSSEEHWESLGDGYRVEAVFVLWQQQNVLQVPNASIFKMGDEWMLYVVEEDQAELRQVTIGRRNGLYAQVLDGVDEGALVIQHPDNSLEDGSRVNVRR